MLRQYQNVNFELPFLCWHTLLPLNELSRHPSGYSHKAVSLFL